MLKNILQWQKAAKIFLSQMMSQINDKYHEQQEVKTTQPFQPGDQGAASTPYRGGEQYEMQTMQHEKSGLPSYDENPTLDSFEDIQRRRNALREDPIMELLDTTKNGSQCKPIERRRKRNTNPKSKRFYQSQISQR